MLNSVEHENLNAHKYENIKKFVFLGGWSGGAKVRPTNLYDSRARPYCACSRCGWGLFGYFYSHLSFLSSVSLHLGDGPI